MKQLSTLVLALALGGCASAGEQVYAPVKNMEYGAISHDPFWLVSVGDDRIVLTAGPAGGAADGELNSYAYPRVRPTYVNGVRRWVSGTGTSVLAMEARQGPCSTGGRRYADRVKISVSGRTMTGCGGREVAAGRRG